MPERLEQREHDVAEVRALPEERRPARMQAFALNAAPPSRSKGNSRRSLAGDRWCPYCQTPLVGTTKQACVKCHPIRQNLVMSGALQAKADEPGLSLDPSLVVPKQTVTGLLDSINDLSRVVALASAHQHNGRRLGKAQVEDMFMACKEVIVLGDMLRRDMTEGDGD